MWVIQFKEMGGGLNNIEVAELAMNIMCHWISG